MEQIRPGAWKIFSNTILRDVVPLSPLRIEVDALGLTDKAQQLNRSALKQALLCLNDGGCLALFPARRVAHFDEQLGARFINYHVEASFQDALYCLLRVDLPSG